MSKSSIYIGLGFFVFGIYELSRGRVEEMIMYSLVGLAFVFTWWSTRPGLEPKNKRMLTIISWVLILAAGFTFLFLVRTDIGRSWND